MIGKHTLIERMRRIHVDKNRPHVCATLIALELHGGSLAAALHEDRYDFAFPGDRAPTIVEGVQCKSGTNG